MEHKLDQLRHSLSCDSAERHTRATMPTRRLALYLVLLAAPLAHGFLLPGFAPARPGPAGRTAAAGGQARGTNAARMKEQDGAFAAATRALRNQRPGIVRTGAIWVPYAVSVAGGAGALVGLGAVGVMPTAAAWKLAQLHTLSTLGFTLWSALRFGLFGGDGERVARLVGGEIAPSDSRAGRVVRTVTQACMAAAESELSVDSRVLALAEHPPTVFVIPTDEPNAFAAGSGQRTVVAVSEGLLQRLNDKELSAVVAHEIGHVTHADVGHHMQQAAMAAGFAGALDLGWRMLMEPRAQGTDKGDSEDADSAMVGAVAIMAVGAVQYALGTLLRLVSSRQDEFAADAFAAQLPGGAEALARALRKIEVGAQ